MGKILIVDDKDNIRQSLGSEFFRLGQRVSEAKNADEAIDKILNEGYDCAVIDLKLDFKSRFGGLRVLNELINIQPDCNFVIISAYTFDDLKEMILNEPIEQKYNKFIDSIRSKYVCKIEEQNYVEAVINKLGFECKSAPWAGKYYASLFAVGKYLDHEIPDLHFPLKDAKKLANILTKYYTFDHNNISIYNNPNRKDIINDLYMKSFTLSSDDNLLIFLAGHGVWDTGRSRGYFLPSNSYKDTPAEWLSYGELADYIRGIKSRHTLIICDACHSGSIFKLPDRKMPPSLTVTRKYNINSRTGIASGDPKQPVPDKSVFLDFLIKNLEKNNSGYFLGTELCTRIIREFEIRNESDQNPVHGIIQDCGDEIGGDFVFIKR